MTFQLSGVPSDDSPAVLATGSTDVRAIFASMSAREVSARDADYLVWHSMDHRPEQYRIAGIRHSIRLVSTPECRAARLRSDRRFDAVDHVMTYFLTADAAFDKFWDLSRALCGERRPFRLPSVYAGYFRLAGKVASRRAISGADVIPWRPARGVYLLVEEDDAPAESLVDVPGVAGVWWHRGGKPPMEGSIDTTGLQLTYCFIDEDLGGTTVLPPSTATKMRLCHAARTALSNAMSVARAGRPMNGIGAAIQRTAKLYGFRVIENLGSHGVGRALHEEPKHIAGYHDPSDQRVLREGMVITIEPFMSTKSRLVTQADDGWTLVGAKGNLSAQFEHTLIIRRRAPILVTTH